ncbi:MAG: enoyl-CoA hydratase/isomerase family protein [Bacteroidota bacterium]
MELLIERSEHVAILTLNRPQSRNALNLSLRRALLDFVKNEAPQFKVIILTGAGTAFCAGMDLKEKLGGDSARELFVLIKAIYDCPSIFIAAVNGVAFGGGNILVTACDMTIASSGARFGLPNLKFGVYPAIAGSFLQLFIGKKAATDMVMMDELFTAEKALRVGLISQIVSKKKLMDEAHNRAQHLTQFDRSVLAASKKLMNTVPLSSELLDQSVEKIFNLFKQMNPQTD